MTSPSFFDIDCLARTLYGEARGEGLRGIEAVACVILNRARDRRWPERIEDVCLQRLQFSCWNADDPNYQKLNTVQLEDADFRRCYAIAAMAVADMLVDATNGANHYCTAALFDDPERRPSWTREDAVTCRIGNHVFMRL